MIGRSTDRLPTKAGRIHPTQKPLDLFAYFIRTYSNPGDVVLDNCIVVWNNSHCRNSGEADFIGFELDAAYHAVAAKRIK
jgi:site-specific DNA-methyltransferase (adenine-specific)